MSMKPMKALGLAVLAASCSLPFGSALAAASAATATQAAPGAKVITNGHVRAVTELLAAMQMEKKMRTIAGTSRYGSDKQRDDAFAKLEKVPPAQIYARLAYPLASSISEETANEMARFYSSSYGQKLVYRMYNSKVGFGEPALPVPTAAERKDMKRPALAKARKELDEAEPVIRRQGFLLLQSIAK